MQTSKQQQGYIVLMAIIVMGAVAVASSLIVLSISSDSSYSSKNAELSIQAQGLANACVEYALDALHQNPAYTGNETLTLGSGECELEPIILEVDIATIQATGLIQDVVRKVEATAQVTTDPTTVQLQSWQEIADF